MKRLGVNASLEQSLHWRFQIISRDNYQNKTNKKQERRIDNDSSDDSLNNIPDKCKITRSFIWKWRYSTTAFLDLDQDSRVQAWKTRVYFQKQHSMWLRFILPPINLGHCWANRISWRIDFIQIRLKGIFQEWIRFLWKYFFYFALFLTIW